MDTHEQNSALPNTHKKLRDDLAVDLNKVVNLFGLVKT